MKNLYAEIGHPFVMEKNKHLEFIKYVEAARSSFINECPKAEN
jgi:hypothetical protein